jgi:hypothetical protein
MMTGSFASSLQGTPRMTHDLDVVVAMNVENIPALLRAFPEPSYYISEPAVREAIEQSRMFNLIEIDSGDKVDFWMLTDEPFDASRFSRKQIVDAQGLRLKVPTPEDTILAKLRWTLDCGESEKHFTDALRVYELQNNDLDFPYLNDWAKRLGVNRLWQRLRGDADPL